MVQWKIPIPDDDDFFEELCCEIWKRIWNSDNVEIFGRNGQSQEGVDIYFDLDDTLCGIQCKCVKELTEPMIDAEIDKAKNFEPNLDSYIIATTFSRDTHLSKHVLKKSKENKKQGLFDVSIKFWGDILLELRKSANSDILKDFFPEFYRDEVHVSKILDDALSYFENEQFYEAEVILNSLKDHVDELNKENRFKFCILDGKFNELCYKFKEAGKNFLESYDYSSKDIISKYYKALGLYYIGEDEQSINICREILKKDSLNDDVYALLILLTNQTEIKIPESLVNSPKILYSKGFIEYNNKEYLKAYNLFKTSTENNLVKLLMCTTTRFIILINDENFPINLSKEKLNKMESIYQSALDKLPDSILIYYKDSFNNLLSVNSLTENLELFRKNIDKGIDLGFDDDEFVYLHAKLLNSLGQNDDAIGKINDFIYSNSRFGKLYTKILADKKDFDTLIGFCEEMLKILDETSEDFVFYINLLFDIYLKKDSNKADNLACIVKTDFYENLFNAQLCDSSGEKINLLNKCLKDIDDVHFLFKFKVAKLFMDEKEYKKAIFIFESYLDTSQYSLYLEYLIECYYIEMEYRKLIQICDNFIEKNEFNRFLFEYEIRCFIKINDFDKVKDLINIYSEKHEKTYLMEFLEARIDIIQGNFEDLDKFLNKRHDFKKLGLELSKEFYNLYYLRYSSSPKLLEILFEIWESYENITLEVHEWYIQESLRLNLDFIKPIIIDYGCGVLINFDGNEQLVYVIGDEETNLSVNQFGYVDELINHKLGDEIKLENGFKINILDIFNKYQYAFRKSQKIINVNKTNSVHPFKFDDIKTSLDMISEWSSNRSKLFDDLSFWYKNKNIPMVFFSKISGLDIIDIYFYLKKLGLKSFSNHDKFLNLNNRLVLDISSLITLYLLDMLDLVKDNYNVSTSYSVLLILKEILNRVKWDMAHESFSVVEENGEHYRVENNYDDKFNLANTLVSFIEDNCELIPSYKLFDLNNKQKEVIKILDESYITENVLIAMDDNILVSDDLPLKIQVSELFNVESCGSLSLIEDLLSKGIIDQNKYGELISELFLLNFNNVPLSSKMIYESVKNGKYGVIFKFLITFYKYPQESVKRICTELLKRFDEDHITEYILSLLIRNMLELL